MHSLQPRPLIHRDVKPHNVLLRPRTSDGGHNRRHGRCLVVVT
jgi:serine/threonine protein kinase